MPLTCGIEDGDGNMMTQRRRAWSAAGAVALTAVLALGSISPANAATNLRMDRSGYATKSNCIYAEGVTTAQILRKGGTIHGGASCTWLGSRAKWGFTILYRL